MKKIPGHGQDVLAGSESFMFETNSRLDKELQERRRIPKFSLSKTPFARTHCSSSLEEAVISVKPALALARRTRRFPRLASSRCMRKLVDGSEEKNKI